MKAAMWGTGTCHPPGDFCRRVTNHKLFLSCFATPFLYERDGELVRGQPGDILLVPAGMTVYHGPTPELETGFVNDWIYLTGQELDGLLEKYPLPLGQAFRVEGVQPLRDYLRLVQQEMTAREPGFEDQIYYLTAQLLLRLHRMYHGGKGGDSARSRLQALRDAVAQDPGLPWTLADMAQRCGYSPSRFSALYRAQFGCAPKQDLLRLRVELARRMLTGTERPVTAIAEECGFANVFYFSRYFKAITGISPTACRQSGPQRK